MADDEETSGTPWGLIFLVFFMVMAGVIFFMGIPAFDQAIYKPGNRVEVLFGGSPDLSYKPGASLMRA